MFVLHVLFLPIFHPADVQESDKRKGGKVLSKRGLPQKAPIPVQATVQHMWQVSPPHIFSLADYKVEASRGYLNVKGLIYAMTKSHVDGLAEELR